MKLSDDGPSHDDDDHSESFTVSFQRVFLPFHPLHEPRWMHLHINSRLRNAASKQQRDKKSTISHLAFPGIKTMAVCTVV